MEVVQASRFPPSVYQVYARGRNPGAGLRAPQRDYLYFISPRIAADPPKRTPQGEIQVLKVLLQSAATRKTTELNLS